VLLSILNNVSPKPFCTKAVTYYCQDNCPDHSTHYINQWKLYMLYVSFFKFSSWNSLVENYRKVLDFKPCGKNMSITGPRYYSSHILPLRVDPRHRKDWFHHQGEIYQNPSNRPMRFVVVNLSNWMFWQIQNSLSPIMAKDAQPQNTVLRMNAS